MKIATCHNAGIYLAQAIGLNTERLVSFSLHVAPGEPLEIRAVYLSKEIVDGALERIERHFTLQEKDAS